MHEAGEILFIADLHLSARQPQLLDLFITFTRDRAAGAAALYILGDLFDAWIGDDQDDPASRAVREALAALSSKGTTIAIQHGNRDFLVGGAFCDASGAALIPDEHVVELCGERTLLMHGDTLCTDDTAYQQARRQLRDPAFIDDFLARPMEERVAIASRYRKMSGEATSLLAADIMDVNQQAVVTAMQRHDVTRLIHGHTHRQAIHHFESEGRQYERIVLGDWNESGGMLLTATSDGIGEERL
jgi:UDP-2,3-diacylglucosamine hydrolase